MKTRLTILSSMAGEDFAQALKTHREWGLRVLDLKDGIFGKLITALSDEEALRAAEMIEVHDLEVYCLSSVLFHRAVEQGEIAFRENELGRIDRLLEIARKLKPQVLRLLSPQMEGRAEIADSIPYLQRNFAWMIPMLQQAIDRIHDGGFHVTIENECGQCVLSKPSEVIDFFAAIDRPRKAHFTWDVQNFWACGTFPTLEVYEKLKPLIGYYHVKGGQHDGTSLRLRWRTALEDASWPVLEITRQIIADGISPVICLNSPHGEPKPGYGYDDIAKRDLDFLRREIRPLEL